MDEWLIDFDHLLIEPPERAAEAILLYAVVGALIVVAFAAWRRWGMRGRELGGPEFSFSNSWASTITVVGALLGTALASGAIVFPDTTSAASAPSEFPSKAEYSAMALLFGVIVVVAPLVYSAFMTTSVTTVPDPDDGNKKVTKKVRVGKVWALLLAGLATLFAVLGQLSVLVLLLLPHIVESDSLSRNVVIAFQWLLVVGIILVALYAARSIPATIDIYTKPDDTIQTWGFAPKSGGDHAKAANWPLL